MSDLKDNQYAPPTAPLGNEKSSKPLSQNAFVGSFLGLLLGALVGLPLLAVSAYAMVKSIVVASIIVAMVSIIIVFLWIRWSKSPNKNIPFDLGFLILLSIFQLLILSTLAFRCSPDYEKFSNPGVLHQSFVQPDRPRHQHGGKDDNPGPSIIERKGVVAAA